VVEEGVRLAEDALPQRPIVLTLKSNEFAAIIERGRDADPDTFKPVPIRDRADHVAFILYSSGTTGLSKGVMLSNLGLVAQIESTRYVPRNDGALNPLVRTKLAAGLAHLDLSMHTISYTAVSFRQKRH